MQTWALILAIFNMLVIPFIGITLTIGFIIDNSIRKLSTYSDLIVSLALPLLMIIYDPIPHQIRQTYLFYSPKISPTPSAGPIAIDAAQIMPTSWGLLFNFICFCGVPLSCYLINLARKAFKINKTIDNILLYVIYLLLTLILVLIVKIPADHYAKTESDLYNSNMAQGVRFFK